MSEFGYPVSLHYGIVKRVLDSQVFCAVVCATLEPTKFNRDGGGVRMGCSLSHSARRKVDRCRRVDQRIARHRQIPNPVS